MKETKFKDTEIGRIPEDWETCTVLSQSSKLVVAFVGTCEKYYTNKGEGVMMLRTGDLKEHSIDYTNIKYISYSFHNANKKSQLKKGDILIARHGSNGHGVIYNKNDEANSLNFVIVHLIDKEYLNTYLEYCLDTNIVRDQIEAATAGSTQKVINSRAIGELIVPKPNIQEQQRIASALTSIDNLISSLSKLIEKKKNIKQGAMQQLLTGQIRLKGFSEPWVKDKLGNILAYEQPTKYLVNTTNYSENGIPVLTAGKTFILGYTNEICGVFTTYPVIIFDDFTTESKYVDFPFKAKSSAMKMLSIKKEGFNNLRFIYEFMQMIDFPMTDHKRYWIEQYSQLIVQIPLKKEKDAITEILAKIDNEITALEAKRAKYEAIKQGMMQQLLTGKIRLIG